MFEEMNRNIQSDVVRIILNTHIDRNRMPQRQKVAEPVTASTEKKSENCGKKKQGGRNELCPCGSGKKYKKCCGIDE